MLCLTKREVLLLVSQGERWFHSAAVPVIGDFAFGNLHVLAKIKFLLEIQAIVLF
jgi:hypothetical protein